MYANPSLSPPPFSLHYSIRYPALFAFLFPSRFSSSLFSHHVAAFHLRKCEKYLVELNGKRENTTDIYTLYIVRARDRLLPRARYLVHIDAPKRNVIVSLAINRYVKPLSRSRSFLQLSHDFRISAISEQRRHCGLPVVVHAHRSEVETTTKSGRGTKGARGGGRAAVIQIADS